MQLIIRNFNELLAFFDSLSLLPVYAKEQMMEMANDNFAFREQLSAAESIHLHIKVAATDQLPHAAIISKGGIPQNEKPGYIKYAFPEGYNFIFSSIPVSQEEKSGIMYPQFPYLDHIGIDIRNESAEAYACFKDVVNQSITRAWPYKKQGGDGKKVSCCHVQVNEKIWVYPPEKVYLEFAFGKLIVNKDQFGCDLRPADPALNLPKINSQACCSSTVPSVKSSLQIKKHRKLLKASAKSSTNES